MNRRSEDPLDRDSVTGYGETQHEQYDQYEPKDDFSDDQDVKEGWSPQKRLMIALVVLLVLGGGGVAIFFLVKHLSSQSDGKQADSDLSNQGNSTMIDSASDTSNGLSSDTASAVVSGASTLLPEEDADPTTSSVSDLAFDTLSDSDLPATLTIQSQASSSKDDKPSSSSKITEGPEQIVRPEGDPKDSVSVPGEAAARLGLLPDPALRLVFDGFDYQPSYVAGCNFTVDDVVKDLHLAAQLTKNIRIYSTDCDMPSKVLEAREALNAELKFWLGLPLIDNVGFEGPLGDISRAIEKYGKEHINGISIGNEYLMNDEAKKNSPEKVATIAKRVEAVRDALPADAKDLPLGYVDISSYFTTAPDALKALDFIGVNIHPWFEEKSTVDSAAGSIFTQFQNSIASATPEQKALSFVAETGWPSNADPGEKSLGGSEPGVANIQISRLDCLSE